MISLKRLTVLIASILLAAVAAILFLRSKEEWPVPVLNDPITTNANTAKPFGESASASIQPTPESSSPRNSISSEDAKKLQDAKKRLPWASEGELQTLMSQGVDVHEIERGRSNIQTDLTQLPLAIQEYRKHFGKYPEGDSAAIARALAGENVEKIVFIVWPEKVKASNGGFLDPWRVPYRITVANETIVVSSAGPDRRFGTSDDLLSN